MKQLLCWHVDLLLLALTDGDLPALIPRDLLAVRPRLGAAVGALVDLAGEGVGHLRALRRLRFMIPELLFVCACHLRNNKLNIFFLELTFLPGHRFTLLGSCPNLEKET